MHWNYRVIKDKNHYSIHEVYYDDQGKVKNWSKYPESPFAYCDSVAEIRSNADLILEATAQAVLDAETLGGME